MNSLFTNVPAILRCCRTTTCCNSSPLPLDQQPAEIKPTPQNAWEVAASCNATGLHVFDQDVNSICLRGFGDSDGCR